MKSIASRVARLEQRATRSIVCRLPPRRLPIEVLDKHELAALLDGCRGHGVTDAHNRALIAVLYRSDLRVSEALSLHPKDVDALSGAIRMLSGKGGRSRTVGIDQGGIEHANH